MDNLNEEQKISSRSKNQSERTTSGSSSLLMIFYCWHLATEEKIWHGANSKEIQVQASRQLFGATHSPSY